MALFQKRSQIWSPIGSEWADHADPVNKQEPPECIVCGANHSSCGVDQYVEAADAQNARIEAERSSEEEQRKREEREARRADIDGAGEAAGGRAGRF